VLFFFSSRSRHTRSTRDWSSDVCSSDLLFCGRKLRQTPPGVGTCRVGEAVWVEEVVEQGLRLLRELEHTGLSQVEFKRDPRDGRSEERRVGKGGGLGGAGVC